MHVQQNKNAHISTFAKKNTLKVKFNGPQKMSNLVNIEKEINRINTIHVVSNNLALWQLPVIIKTTNCVCLLYGQEVNLNFETLFLNYESITVWK